MAAPPRAGLGALRRGPAGRAPALPRGPVCGDSPDGARSRRRGGLGGAQRRGARRGPALRRPVLVPVQRPTVGQGDLPDHGPGLVRIRRRRERDADRADVPRQHHHVGLRAAPADGVVPRHRPDRALRHHAPPRDGPGHGAGRGRPPPGAPGRGRAGVQPPGRDADRVHRRSSGRTPSPATPSSSPTTPWRSRSRPRRSRRSAPTTYAPTGAPSASSPTSWPTSGSATA